jgi:leader peptidase (prepilin peptidase)/N-methyltransferase
MPVLITTVAVLGLAIGSFLNVVIYRLPQEKSLSTPASQCPVCEHPIRKRHNIPVLGWLVLRGRCHDCASSINVRYPLVEFVTGVLFVAITVRMAQLHLLAALPAFLFFASIAVALTLIDIDVHRLPNGIVLPSFPVLALSLTIASVVRDDPASVVRSAICGMALFAFYLVLAFAYPAGMGFGDVKLAGVIGGVLGYLSYQALLVGAAAAFVIGGAAGVLVILTRRGTGKTAIPFGPFMICGALLAIFASTPIAEGYLRVVLRT